MAYQLNEKLVKLKPYQPIQGEYKIRLDANESFIDIFPQIAADVIERLHDEKINRYPDPYAEKVSNAFADFYNISRKNVTAGNGSDELISIITSTFLCRDDKFVYLSDDFSMYKFYGEIFGVEGIQFEKNSNLEIDVDKLIDFCNISNAKMLIFSNPCNPTSLGITKDEVAKIIKSVSCLVVLDEAYMDFWTESTLDSVDKYDNLIILKTCSKALGLAGIRLGFAVAGERITQALQSVKSPYNTDSYSQMIGEVFFSKKELAKSNIYRIINSRNDLFKAILLLSNQFKIVDKVYETRTNFVLFKSKYSNIIFNKLLEKSISVRNFGEYIRITAGSENENAIVIQSLIDIFRHIEESAL